MGRFRSFISRDRRIRFTVLVLLFLSFVSLPFPFTCLFHDFRIFYIIQIVVIAFNFIEICAIFCILDAIEGVTFYQA